MEYITNGVITIGIDVDQGCTIRSLAEVSDGVNLLMPNGEGIVLAVWGGESALWNPNQTGSFQRLEYSPTLQYSNGGDSFYGKVDAVNFNGSGPDALTYMEMWVTLQGHVVKLKYKATYYGGVDQTTGWEEDYEVSAYPPEAYGGWMQEAPAFYLRNDKYSRYRAYIGTSPWTGGALTSFTPPQIFPGTGQNYKVPSEHWVAALDANDYGIGIYSFGANAFNVINFQDTTGLYMAPGPVFNFTPGAVFDCETHVTIGSLSDIRERFYGIQFPPPFQPPAGRYPTAQTVTLTSPTGGTIYYTLDGSDPRIP